MRPKKHETTGSADLFRARLDQIINMRHELVQLAGKIDWEFIDGEIAPLYSDGGRPGIATQFVIGLFLLKHIYGLSDEGVCERWVYDPYFQHFTGEEFFQHEFPHERSDLSHWRKRLGGKLEGPMRLTETADRPRSDALKDVRASHPYHATIRADICRDPSRNNGRRADEASRPYRRYSAIRRPIPRCLEHHPRTLNAPHHIIGDCRTWTHWAAEENSGEISGSWVDRQNFQD